MSRYSGIVIFPMLLLALNCFSQQVNHWETIIKAEDDWKYILPAAEPDTNWRYASFNDNSWNSGKGGFGYGDNDDGTLVPSGTRSVFIRKTFTVTDTSTILQMVFNADYDDAFVAYLNGNEIARANITGIHPAFDQLALSTHEAVMYSGGVPDMTSLLKTQVRRFLVNGINVLAIQIHNDAVTSSDMTGKFYLTAGIKDASFTYSNPPQWFTPPVQAGTSNLPIIVIDTYGQSIPDQNKITAHMGIIDNGPGNLNHIEDPFNNYDGRIGIELHGSSSLTFPKKSYSFETRTLLDSNLNVPLLGLPEENDWILYGPYPDKTFLRNILAYKLSNEMGHYAPRTVPCELYLNNIYNGVYVLIEKIKQGKNRVKIADLKPTEISGSDLTGGYIFKIDKGATSGNNWQSAYTPKGFTDKYIYFQYVYPKPEDIVSQQKNYIQSFVNQFENTLASDYFTHTQIGYQRYIDVVSFVDYFLVNELSKNVDAYRISSYFHKDRDDKNNKIVAGPVWDYDLTFGNANYYGGDQISGWIYNSSSLDRDDYWQVPFWWQRFMQDPYFCTVLKERYTLLRQDVLKTDSIWTYIDKMALMFADPQARNFARWPILGTYVWPNPYLGKTYKDEITYFKNWIRDRLLWMDANLSSILLTGQQNITQIVNPVANVYPNPFSEFLNIDLFPNEGASKASLYLNDITGKLIFSDVTAISHTEKTPYALSDKYNGFGTLPAGIYLLKIKLDNGNEMQAKLIKP